MVDRVTKVTLTANVASYIAGMDAAAKKTRELGTSAEKLAQQKQSITTLGTAMVGLGAVAAVGVGAAVVEFAKFSKQMAQVQSLSHATATQIDGLTKAALTMGQSIGFSATEVADGETELVKAGVSVSAIMGGALKGSLDLAAAGQISVADATSVAAEAMTQFKLKGSDVPHIADLLSAGADKALGSVGQLGQALSQSGLVASQFGLTVDQTVGTLSEFAQAGLLGSDAGTSLKQMFLQLASPSKQASETMQKLGISAYDAQGKFVGITALAGELQAKLGGLTEAQRNAALSIIFGSDAIRAANILYTDGAAGSAKWISSVNDSGFAAEQAAGKMNNLSGDTQKLAAAFQTDLIRAGSAANGSLRGVTQTLTGIVTAIGNIPQPVADVGLGVASVAAGVGLVGGGLLLAVPKVAEFKDALSTLDLTSGKVKNGLGKLSVAAAPTAAAFAVASIALDGFLQTQARGASQIADFQQSLNQESGALTDYSKKLLIQNLEQKDQFGPFTSNSTFEDAQKLGLSLKTVTDAAEGNKKAIREISQAYNEFNSGPNQYDVDKSQQWDHVTKAIADQRNELGKAKGLIEQTNQAEGNTKGASDAAASGLDSVASSAETATQKLSDLQNEISGFGSVTLDVDSATRDYFDAIDTLTTSVKTNGQTLDVTTQKGRDNQAALEGIATSTLKLSSATLASTNSQTQATSVVEKGRAAFIAAAEQAGQSASAANKYADQLGLIPKDVSTAIQASGIDTVEKKVADYKKKLASIPSGVSTTAYINTTSAMSAVQSLKAAYDNIANSAVLSAPQLGPSTAAALAKKKAGGGYITGPGSATSDSIPARLSDGEFVLKASAVDRIGVATLNAMNNGYANGGLVGLASGGSVSKAATAAAKKRAAEQAKLAKQLAKLNSDQFSFLSDVARGNLTGSSAVDSLYSTASTRTGPAQIAMLNTALQFDRSLTKLTKSSDAASSKLSDLQSSAASLKSSVAASVGTANVGNYRSASGLENGLSRTATQTHEFASLLHTLQQKGVAPALLSDIANMGTVQGLPLARSLANSSTADIKSINSNYQAIGNFGNYAGQVVSDANYKTQIAAADKNARSLEAQIAKQSLAIQKVIGHALKVPGYSTGGYTGPSRVGDVAGVVHGQEFVVNARATAAHRAELEQMNAGYPGYAAGGYVRPVYVRSDTGFSAGNMRDMVRSVVAEMPRGDINSAFHAHPVQNLDPETALTIMSREIGRQFSGILK